MKRSRRDFIRDTACGLTAAAVVNSLDRLSIINAMVQQQPEVASDYRALVCVFLSGGSDCNNMVVPIDAEWSDIGSWPSVWRAAGKDADGNAVSGNAVLHGVTNSYVRSDGAATAVIGLDGIAVINTGHGLLVAPLDRARELAAIADRLPGRK